MPAEVEAAFPRMAQAMETLNRITLKIWNAIKAGLLSIPVLGEILQWWGKQIGKLFNL